LEGGTEETKNLKPAVGVGTLSSLRQCGKPHPSFASKETISLLSKRHFEDRVHYKSLATFLDNAVNCTVIVESSVGEEGVLNESVTNCNQVRRVKWNRHFYFAYFGFCYSRLPCGHLSKGRSLSSKYLPLFSWVL